MKFRPHQMSPFHQPSQSSWDLVRGNLSSEAGFTLMELLVVISILGILGAIAVINHNSLSDSFHKKNARQQLEIDFRRVRQMAMTQGCRGVITIAANGRSYSAGCDYAPYSSPAVIEVLTFSSKMPPDITVSGSTVIFDSRGQSVDVFGSLVTSTYTVTLRGKPAMIGTLYPIGYLDF